MILMEPYHIHVTMTKRRLITMLLNHHGVMGIQLLQITSQLTTQVTQVTHISMELHYVG